MNQEPIGKIFAGQFEKCTVLALIPEDALSPLEQWTKRWDDLERKRTEEIWRNYVTAIWHHIGFAAMHGKKRAESSKHIEMKKSQTLWRYGEINLAVFAPICCGISLNVKTLSLMSG